MESSFCNRARSASIACVGAFLPHMAFERDMKHFAEGLATHLLILAAAMALAACMSTGDPLQGTRWKLSGWTVSSIDPASLGITASFAEGAIAGNSAVNRYSGPYTTGSGNVFSVGPLAATRMAGPEPAMRAETAYLTLLGEARSYRLTTASQLTLFDSGGNASLIFDRSLE
jgi:heat shock protein HslJ